MKEKLLKSFATPSLGVQILDGKFALLWDEDDNEISVDNENYAYEVLRLLKEADRLGAFDHIKKDPEESDVEKVFI